MNLSVKLTKFTINTAPLLSNLFGTEGAQPRKYSFLVFLPSLDYSFDLVAQGGLGVLPGSDPDLRRNPAQQGEVENRETRTL